MFTTVEYEISDSIARITLNRPERLNAVNPQLIEDLYHAIDQAIEDGARALILSGKGRAFCAGFDLKHDEGPVRADEERRRFQKLQEISRKLKQAKFPVIAAIHGYALGAGSEFALSCDLVYAGADTKIGFPEVGVGLSIGCGITHLLPKTVGLMKAKELVFLGELIGAQEAKNLGLINDVVPNERLAEKVDAVAYRLIEQPQLALEKAKIALNQGIQSDIESAYDLETEHAVALRAHPDAKEKAESFRER